MHGDTAQDSRPQFSIKWLLIAVGICGVVFAVIRFGQRVVAVPHDAHAMWAAGDIVI